MHFNLILNLHWMFLYVCSSRRIYVQSSQQIIWRATQKTWSPERHHWVHCSFRIHGGCQQPLLTLVLIRMWRIICMLLFLLQLYRCVSVLCLMCFFIDLLLSNVCALILSSWGHHSLLFTSLFWMYPTMQWRQATWMCSVSRCWTTSMRMYSI